jgi:imidazolonepropionase-like amidohydrolase
MTKAQATSLLSALLLAAAPASSPACAAPPSSEGGSPAVAATPAGPAPPTATPAVAPRPTAFVGVTVLPLDSDRVLPDQTVVVRDGRIVAVGPRATVVVPADAERIDGGGKVLMPGLAEMHGHIPPPQGPPGEIDDTLFLYLARGITTVRGMLGHPGQLTLRQGAADGTLLSPTLYLAGPSFNGQSVSSPEQAAAMVRDQAREGWDLLKVHPGVELAEYEAMARTAREVGIRFGGHVPADVGLERAIALGQETFDHLDGYVEALGGDRGPVDPAALAALVKKTRDAGAAVVPTMALWEVLYGTADLAALVRYPELAYVPPAMVEAWKKAFANRLAHPAYDAAEAKNVIDNRVRVLRALHEGGVSVVFGTDAPQQFSVPGFSLFREIPYMQAAGMSSHAILHSATRAVGQYFEKSDIFGQVAVGHRADLLLLDGNPLADLGALQRQAGVMVRGRWLPKAEIDRRLEAIAAKYRQ